VHWHGAHARTKLRMQADTFKFLSIIVLYRSEGSGAGSPRPQRAPPRAAVGGRGERRIDDIDDARTGGQIAVRVLGLIGQGAVLVDSART
jgi:hypothetical protein